MKKQISLKNGKLSINKEKVASLSEKDMDQIIGGSEAAASTRTTLTCGWCTSTTSVED